MFRVIAYKYGKFYREKTGKNAVLSMLIQETTKPDNITYNKKTVNLFYTDGKFSEKYTLPIEFYCGTAWKQWVADVYHCSETWGQRMTEDEMKTMLEEHMKEKFPEDYSPDPAMYKACTTYWNELCDMYQN